MIWNAGVINFAALLLLCLVMPTIACSRDSASDNDQKTSGSGEPDGGSGAADEVELEYWRTVRDSEHSDDLWAYLEKYPNGAFADLAKAKLERLMRDGGSPAAGTAGPGASPPTVRPPNEASSVRRTREQIVRDAVRRTTGRYSDPRIHVAPNIPRLKLDNVARVHDLDTSRVLFLYDDGFSGGGKTGFCLTDRKIYWRFISGSPAYSLDFEDIDQVRVMKKKLTVNGYDVGTTMAADPRRAAEIFADLLEEIRDLLRRR